MPKLIIAIVDDPAEADRLVARVPLKTPVAAVDIDYAEVNTYPVESILELSVRPAAIAVIQAWRHGKA